MVSAAPAPAHTTFHAGTSGSALGRWFSYYSKKHAPAPAPTPAPQPDPEEEPEEAESGGEEPAEKKEKKKAEPVEEQKEEMAEAPEPEAVRVESTAEEPAEETFTPVRPCTLFSAGCSGSTLQCAAPPQPTWPAVNCAVCVVVLCCVAYRLTPLAMVAPAQL